MAKTKENARALVRAESRPIARDRTEVFSRLTGIVVGEDPAQGIFQGKLFLHPELEFAISFPADWKTMNTASTVGAFSPSKDAVVSLRIAERDAELTTVMKQLKAEQPGLTFERMTIHGLPAANTLLKERVRSWTSR